MNTVTACQVKVSHKGAPRDVTNFEGMPNDAASDSVGFAPSRIRPYKPLSVGGVGISVPQELYASCPFRVALAFARMQPLSEDEASKDVRGLF